MRSSLLLSSGLASVAAAAFSSSNCVVTEYSDIQAALANCNHITLQNVHCPDNSSLDLSAVRDGSVITFAGTTTFGYVEDHDFKSIVFGGNNVVINATADAIIDGNGKAYWDGLGSNGGISKPNQFITVTANNSIIENLHIINYPVHGIAFSYAHDVIVRGVFIDLRDGDAPNNRSGTKAAAHNSDGFGVGTLSHNIFLTNSTVYNQDDCVAITSANNVTVSDFWCSGSHGFSIGSIGGKTYNNVTNVLIQDSYIQNSSMAARIKSNYNTTGYIANITYSNIQMKDITTYGIDIQQDYLNGGPVGNATSGVIIENVLFHNLTGTVTEDAMNYYVLCGDTSCRNLVFEDCDITGGGVASSCNEPETGCPA